jgi:hypothetical protein
MSPGDTTNGNVWSSRYREFEPVAEEVDHYVGATGAREVV